MGTPFLQGLQHIRGIDEFKLCMRVIRYPDVRMRMPGRAEQIVDKRVSIIPEFRPLFPVSFRLRQEFPPSVLVHGDADVLVRLLCC